MFGMGGEPIKREGDICGFEDCSGEFCWREVANSDKEELVCDACRRVVSQRLVQPGERKARHEEKEEARVSADLCENDEEQSVLEWRLRMLVEAGFKPDAALQLALDSLVDLHEACELHRRGCSEELALRILL